MTDSSPHLEGRIPSTRLGHRDGEWVVFDPKKPHKIIDNRTNIAITGLVGGGQYSSDAVAIAHQDNRSTRIVLINGAVASTSDDLETNAIKSAEIAKTIAERPLGTWPKDNPEVGRTNSITTDIYDLQNNNYLVASIGSLDSFAFAFIPDERGQFTRDSFRLIYANPLINPDESTVNVDTGKTNPKMVKNPHILPRGSVLFSSTYSGLVAFAELYGAEKYFAVQRLHELSNPEELELAFKALFRTFTLNLAEFGPQVLAEITNHLREIPKNSKDKSDINLVFALLDDRITIPRTYVPVGRAYQLVRELAVADLPALDIAQLQQRPTEVSPIILDYGKKVVDEVLEEMIRHEMTETIVFRRLIQLIPNRLLPTNARAWITAREAEIKDLQSLYPHEITGSDAIRLALAKQVPDSIEEDIAERNRNLLEKQNIAGIRSRLATFTDHDEYYKDPFYASHTVVNRIISAEIKLSNTLREALDKANTDTLFQLDGVLDRVRKIKIALTDDIFLLEQMDERKNADPDDMLFVRSNIRTIDKELSVRIAQLKAKIIESKEYQEYVRINNLSPEERKRSIEIREQFMGPSRGPIHLHTRDQELAGALYRTLSGHNAITLPLSTRLEEMRQAGKTILTVKEVKDLLHPLQQKLENCIQEALLNVQAGNAKEVPELIRTIKSISAQISHESTAYSGSIPYSDSESMNEYRDESRSRVMQAYKQLESKVCSMIDAPIFPVQERIDMLVELAHNGAYVDLRTIGELITRRAEKFDLELIRGFSELTQTSIRSHTVFEYLPRDQGWFRVLTRPGRENDQVIWSKFVKHAIKSHAEQVFKDRIDVNESFYNYILTAFYHLTQNVPHANFTNLVNNQSQLYFGEITKHTSVLFNTNHDQKVSLCTFLYELAKLNLQIGTPIELTPELNDFLTHLVTDDVRKMSVEKSVQSLVESIRSNTIQK